MQGMWQYAISEIRLEVSAGECGGCDFGGVVNAVIDPTAEAARWMCPACRFENESAIPTGDPDWPHDERGADL